MEDGGAPQHSFDIGMHSAVDDAAVDAESLVIDDIEEYFRFHDFHRSLECFRQEREEQTERRRRTGEVPGDPRWQEHAHERREQVYVRLLRSVDSGNIDEFKDSWCELVPTHMRRFDLETMRIEFMCVLAIAVA